MTAVELNVNLTQGETALWNSSVALERNCSRARIRGHVRRLASQCHATVATIKAPDGTVLESVKVKQ